MATVTVDPALEFLRAIWKLDHDLQVASKRMAITVGLTGPQRLCLLQIARRPGIAPSELASELHLDRGTITGIVARLEQAGFVTRENNPHDGRGVHLRLTAKGRSVNRTRPTTIESAVRRAVRRVAPRDITVARRLLATVSQELIELGDAAGTRSRSHR